jgi:hypothetical protein
MADSGTKYGVGELQDSVAPPTPKLREQEGDLPNFATRAGTAHMRVLPLMQVCWTFSSPRQPPLMQPFSVASLEKRLDSCALQIA